MNGKDKEAFEAWWKEYTSNLSDTPTEWDVHDAWQAACEYMRDEFKFQTPPAVFIYQDMNDKLQAENKKLREALEFYANSENFNIGEFSRTVYEYREDGLGSTWIGKKARKVLGELK